MRSNALPLAVLGWLVASPALAALSIDAAATANNVGTSAALALTETNANDLIVLDAVTTSGSTASSTVGDSCGRTWAKRFGGTWAGGVGGIEEWYTTSSAVYNCTITVTYAASTTWRLVGFGVNGANLTTPWDANASLPAAAATSSATTLSPTAALATTSASSMVISVLRTIGSAGTITNPSGFSAVLAAGSAEQAADRVYSSAQTGLSPQWAWTTGSQNAVALWDAVQAAAGAAGSTDTGIFQGIP